MQSKKSEVNDLVILHNRQTNWRKKNREEMHGKDENR